MADIASILKEEIARLARKELKRETSALKKASVQYRAEIAALKRRAASLEQQLARYEKAGAKTAGAKPAVAEKKARFTAKGFITLRQRLGLTAEAMGALLGVSAQTVYNWEAGGTSPRAAQLAKIVTLRGMGKREVSAIIKQMGR